MTAPYVPQKQSILDRLVSRLFPATQMLDPQVGQSVGRQGLLQLGANLLQAGGASPMQRGTLANIGASIGGVDINALTKQAMVLQAYQNQQATDKRIGEIAARHPVKPGETPDQTYERIASMVSELAGQPGTEDLLGKLSNVLAQLRPARELRQRYKWETVVENGVPVRYRVNVDDPTDRIAIGTPMTPQTGLPSDTERRAGALFTVAQDAYNKLRDAQAPNLQDYLAGKIPLGLGQAAISAKQQQQNQAGAVFYRSYLYIVSGATVNEGEALEAAKSFVPQWGDDPALVQQKLDTQEVMLQAMRQARGRAGNQPGNQSGGSTSSGGVGIPRAPRNPFRK